MEGHCIQLSSAAVENVTSIKHLKCEGLSYLVGIDKRIDFID